MLFAFLFNFWASTVAVGAAAVSIPIVIHLLNRRRFKIVDWAAMRFLLAAQRQTTRKMRLEQIILLTIRCLLVLLLVLAMASVMPWAEDLWASIWPDKATRLGRPEGRVHHILVIDGSLSMNQTAEDGGTAFQKAINEATKLVENGQHDGDGYSILLLKDNPTWEMGPISQIRRRVADRLRELKASQGNASLSSALNMINSRILESTRRFNTQVVYFFTDVQRSTWQSAMDLEKKEGEAEENILLEIQKEAQFAIIDVGRPKAENCAVVDLYLNNPLITTGQTLELTATIQNFGEEAKRVELEFLVARARDNKDDPAFSFQNRPIDAKLRAKDVSPGRREDVRLQDTFKEAGTYVLQVRVKSEGDKLEADNARYLVVTVKERIPILIVCGVPGDVNKKKYLDKVTDLVKEALNPAPGEEDGWTRLIPEVRTQEEFGRMKREDLTKYDCLFLADISAPSREEVEYMQDFLRRGRGVVMALGDLSARDVEDINKALFKDDEGLLPAKLQKKITAPEKHFFTLNAEGDAFNLPPLKAFADSKDRISIASRPFESYVQATPASARVRTVLSYALEVEAGTDVKIDPNVPNGDVAIVEWNPRLPARKAGAGKGSALVYPGKFVLLTSTLHKRPDGDRALGDGWNYWAGSPSYVALMQELVRLTVPTRLIGQSSLVSEPLDDVFTSPGRKVEAAVSYPQDPTSKNTSPPRKIVLPPTDDLLEFRFAETDYVGVYRVTLDVDGREIPFAINFPAITADKRGSESNLYQVSGKELEGLYPGFKFNLVDSVSGVSIEKGPRETDLVEKVDLGPGIARVLAMAMLFLLFFETILAWQFGHYSKVEGSTPPAPVGASWLLLIAGIAIVLFAAGAFVLIHEQMTGDFLSFLPDRFRSWVETKVLNLEPPPPGETSKWTLEREPWLPAFLERNWFVLFLSIGSLLLILTIYRLEGPSVSYWFKGLLGGLRFFLLMMVMFAFLPQLKMSIDRQGMPEIVVIIDDSLSMGVTDNFQNGETRDKAKQYHESIRTRLKERLPGRINELKTQVADLKLKTDADAKFKPDLDDARLKLAYLELQANQIGSPSWRPSRLNLAQAVVLNPEKDWLRFLFKEQRSKAHVFHLDSAGKATKLTDAEGVAGDLLDPNDYQAPLERAKKAVAALEPSGKDSQLGLSIRETINQYRGSALTAVIMITDGVTTRDETIKEVSEYARRASVPLYFLGIGDDHFVQNLELDGLQVDDTIYLGDRALFQAKIIGKGYKDLEVPIVLKTKEKDGREKEVDRVKRKVDPDGKPVKFTLLHQPSEAGKKTYIIEVELPRGDKDKTPGGARLRLERTIEVIETKTIRVLYVEGQPRYEYRYLKSLLERESPDKKKNKSVTVRTLLLDADDNYHKTDATALRDFPTKNDLEENYDVIILGDCDPRHPKLGEARLKMIADFVRGDEGKTKRKTNGAGLLFLSGPFHNPHGFRDTALGPLLPVEPFAAKPPPEPDNRNEKLRIEWTTLGRLHNIFKLVPDDAENNAIWKRISPMYWWSTGYKARERAEVLAVHPAGAGAAETKHPLIVQQLVGAGRTMFFGFEETWRWRYRDDEVHYNHFWMQTLRYMARVRQSRTELRLDRQTPYRDGDTIKVTVTFPDTLPGLGAPAKEEFKPEVVVIAEHQAEAEEGQPPPKMESQRLALAKVIGSTGHFEAALPKARAGKYNFWLYSPDVRKTQPDGEAPSASALVELPPQELEDLRLNQTELFEAAQKTRGRFYTLGEADRLLDELPEPERPNLGAAASKQKLWNHWLFFATAIMLFSGEWILRKKKHLL